MLRVPLNLRYLRDDETAFARKVFKSSLPYDRIKLGKNYLPGNDGVPVTTRQASEYTIYFGPNVFKNGAHIAAPTTFIHELTHVWQGHNSNFPWGYMIKSLWSQGKALVKHGDRNRAYEYDDSNYLPWPDYNVEQQASIIADWFSGDNGKASDIDPRFVYISCNIRPGAPASRKTPKQRSVASGDTLWGIAEREYGEGQQWKRLYEANKRAIGDNPNRLRVGQKLFIPAPLTCD